MNRVLIIPEKPHVGPILGHSLPKNFKIRVSPPKKIICLLSDIWLPQGQLWVTAEGAASLTQCSSLHFYLF